MSTLTHTTGMHRIAGVARRRSLVHTCDASYAAWQHKPSIHVMGAFVPANGAAFRLTDGTHQRPLEPKP